MPAPQIFDIIALILVGWLTLRGAMRGIVAQILSIVSIVASWIIAVKFSPIIAPMISDEAPGNRLIAMLILFVAGYFAIWLIRGLLDDVIKAIRLKNVDRSLGALLGFAKGVLLCLIITFFLVIFSPASRDFVLGSISGKYFATGVERISVLIPADVSEILSKNITKFQGLLEEKPVPNLHPLENLKESISNILPPKNNPEPQLSPQPSLVREKVAATPAPAVETPAPMEPPRRAVLPFQPNR